MQLTKNDVREIVLELLKELVHGTIRNEAIQDADGDEHNDFTFDGELFVDRVYNATS